MRNVGIKFLPLLWALHAIAYQYEVSMCCIFQNEDRFIKEWIDYHQLIGVQHFYMYDNLSTDDCRAVLEPYIQAGIVEYIFWDKTYDSPKDWWRVQRGAYFDAIERSIGVSKWLCVTDTDEFIVPIQDCSLPAFLRDFESFGGVFINWVYYGSSGIQRLASDDRMITKMLYRAKLNHSGHRLVKSMVRPERVDIEKSSFPHTCAYLSPFYHVNPNKERPIKGQPNPICIDRIRIHHYWSRDLDYLYEDKFLRNERWYGTEKALKKIQAEREMNEFYDPLILEVMDRCLTR